MTRQWLNSSSHTHTQWHTQHTHETAPLLLTILGNPPLFKMRISTDEIHTWSWTLLFMSRINPPTHQRCPRHTHTHDTHTHTTHTHTRGVPQRKMKKHRCHRDTVTVLFPLFVLVLFLACFVSLVAAHRSVLTLQVCCASVVLSFLHNTLTRTRTALIHTHRWNPKKRSVCL